MSIANPTVKELLTKTDGQNTAILKALAEIRAGQGTPQPTPTPTPTPVPTPTPTPVPTPTPTPTGGYAPSPFGGEQLIVSDTIVLPGERVANVVLRLAKPLQHQVTWEYLTRNGDPPNHAYEGGHYTGAGGWVTFMPGEVEKVISVPLLADLGPTHFYLNLAWSKNQPAMGGALCKIIGGTSRPALPPVPPVALKAPAKTAGRTLKLDENFLGPISATGEAGKWWSRFGWGDVQGNNGEVAPYANKIEQASGVDPHPLVSGKRVLRAGVGKTKSVKGNTAGLTYDMYASMVQGENVFSFTNGYIELVAAIRADVFCVPAFWMVTGAYGSPSYAEVDWFEFGLGGDPWAHETVHSGVSWVEGVGLPHKSDGKPHTYGCDVTPAEHVMLIDGVVVHRRPNPFPNLTFPGVILNIGIGGALGPAPDIVANPGWTAEMELHSLKVWA